LKTKSRYLAAVMAIVFLAGCAKLHRTPNADGTPTAPITPLEQVNADNAQISVHNHAVAEALVAAHQSGFVESEYFNTLSAGQIRITRIHQQLTPLLAQPVAANVAQIKGLLTELNDVANQMVTDGTAGVKNPQAKDSIITEVNSVISLAKSITSTLTTTGLLK
jgi:hypothetical protein